MAVNRRIKNIYFTLYQILDTYKVENKRGNVGAMKHIDGIFASDMVIPVRKKIAENHVRNYFFYEIMDIHPNYQKDKISGIELQSYILGKKKHCKAAYYLDNLKECYWNDALQGETPIYIQIKESEKKQINDGEKQKESESDGIWITDSFQEVDLNMTYILERIEKDLLKSMRRYWNVVRSDGAEQTKIDAYADFHVGLTIYEIFLRKFSEQTEKDYLEYTRFTLESKEALEYLNSGEATEEEAMNIVSYFNNYVGDEFYLVEEINKHVALYTAALMCMAFVELYNMRRYYFKKHGEVVSSYINVPKALEFEKNGNSANSIYKLVNELVDKLKEKQFFTEFPIRSTDPIVKNIFALLDYVADDRWATLHMPESAEEIQCTRLHELAVNVAWPLLQRHEQIVVIEEL